MKSTTTVRINGYNDWRLNATTSCQSTISSHLQHSKLSKQTDITRDVKVSRPTWSQGHFFGLGLGLGLTVIGLGLGLGLMR